MGYVAGLGNLWIFGFGCSGGFAYALVGVLLNCGFGVWLLPVVLGLPLLIVGVLVFALCFGGALLVWFDWVCLFFFGLDFGALGCVVFFGVGVFLIWLVVCLSVCGFD